MIILSKDPDFFDQMLLNGPPPPVVWIRWGNLRRKELETLLANQWPKVMKRYHLDANIILRFLRIFPLSHTPNSLHW